LSIVFVSSSKIRALNKKFLKRNYATDVLAFDLKDNGTGKKVKEAAQGDIYGEIIISTDAARQHAQRYHLDIKGEIVRYLIHGILHLCGYDDHSDKEIKKMRTQEESLMLSMKSEIQKVI